MKSATIDNSSAQLTARSMISRHGLDKAERLAGRFVEDAQRQAREFWIGVAAEIEARRRVNPHVGKAKHGPPSFSR
jgi:hypothetical protein